MNMDRMERQQQREPMEVKLTMVRKVTKKKMDYREVDHAKDAVFGRGADANRVRKHSLYRDLLRKNCETYWKTPKKLKNEFVVVQVVKPIVDGGGRFVQSEKGTARYKILFPKGKDHGDIVKRIQQAFRDIKKAANTTTTTTTTAKHKPGLKKFVNRLVRVVSRDEDDQRSLVGADGIIPKEGIMLNVAAGAGLKGFEIQDLEEPKKATMPKLQVKNKVDVPMFCGNGLLPACFPFPALAGMPPTWYGGPIVDLNGPHWMHPALLPAIPVSSLALGSSSLMSPDNVSSTVTRTHKVADTGDAVLTLKSSSKRCQNESIGHSPEVPRALTEPFLADLCEDRSCMGFDNNKAWSTIEHIFTDTNDGVVTGTDCLADECSLESNSGTMVPQALDVGCFDGMIWDDVDIVEDGDDYFVGEGMAIGCGF